MYGDYQAPLEGLKRQYEQLEQLAARQQAGVADSLPAPQQVPTVVGIEGARAYRLGKSSSVALFDTEEDTFYFRKTDSNGNEIPMKVGHYKLEDAPKSESDFVTVKDFEALKTEILGLLREKTAAKKAEGEGATE
jgi:hypothetical protein